MDLFRRIFGKVGEEELPLTKPASPKDAEDSNNRKQHLIDEIDSSTYPVDVRLSETEGDEESRLSAPLPSHRTLINPDGVTQPLHHETVPNITDRRLVFGQSSDVGRVRNNNQDSSFMFFSTSTSVDEYPDFGLFIVADGMGGHHDGEKASAITTRVLSAQIMQNVYLPLVSGERAKEPAPVTEALIAAVRKANLEVIRQVPEGGTTVTAVTVIGDLAHVVHVGDSRAYIITTDGVDQITRDHSLVQRLIELDQLTPEEAQSHPQANVLYRAIGQSDTLEVDAITRRLPQNARVLICSDGLWGQIDEKEIFETVMNIPDPQRATEKLVELANKRGGKDNTTVILLKLG